MLGGLFSGEVGLIAWDGPGAGGFGDEGFDELGAAGIAEERLVAEEEQGGDGFAFGQAGQEFFVGDAGHAKEDLTSFSVGRETEAEERVLPQRQRGRRGSKEKA